MAKVVKTSKKRRGGVKTRVITKYRTVKVAAKRGAKRVRRAVSVSVSKKDIAVTVAAGGAGAIGSALVVSKMPESVPDIAKNGIMVAVGAFVAYRGFKKRNKVMIGAGIGAASVGITGAITAAKTAANTATVSGMPLAVPYSAALNAPLAAPVDAIDLAAPFAGFEKATI